MATIQSLNPIYLSGNLPNFGVLSAADQAAVVVKLNGSEILNEVYNPANGGFVIKLKYLLCSLLYATIPPADVDAIVQDKSLGTVQILITDGIAAVDESFLVLKGGVETDPDVDVFLTTNFLTWQPQVKKIQYADPEFLTYCSLQACRVKVKAYFADDTDQTITFWTLAANDVYTFNLAYARLVGKFSAQPTYFDVWTEDMTGERLSYIQRYIYIEPFTLYNDVFVFENTLGGIDTVHFLGEIQESNDFTIGSALFDETTLEYDIDISIVFNKKTGYVEKESDRYWWLEFFKSLQRYHISEGALKRIFVTKPKLDSIPGAPNGYEFSFAYAFQTKYISLPRLDTLPVSVDITDPSGELFFLAPRLAQFPWIDPDDNPLIAVQLPYSSTWGVTSIEKLFESFNRVPGGFSAPVFSSVPDGDITDNTVLVLSPSGAVKKKTLGSMSWADASDFETGATARGKYLTGFDTSFPGMFTVNSSPSGPSARSFNVSLASQLRNTVLAGPMGSTGVPTFRSLIVADIPTGLPYAPDTTVSFPGFGTSHILAAYGDHDHAGVYLTSESDPVFTAWNKSTGITIVKSQVSDFPTTLPASDVYAWAKAATKPSYGWTEIGSRPSALSAFTNDLGNYGGFVTGTPWTAVGYWYASSHPTTLSGYGITDTPWTGYLPLSAGSENALTGTLYGTGASFSGNVGIGASAFPFNLTVSQQGTGVISYLGIRAGENGSASLSNVASLCFRIRGGGAGDVDANINHLYDGIGYVLQYNVYQGHSFIVNGTERFRIGAIGAAAFSSSVSAAQFNSQTANFISSSGVGVSGVDGLVNIVTAERTAGLSVGQSGSIRHVDILANGITSYVDDLYLSGNIKVVINNDASSTSSSTGALVVVGGIGVGGAAYVGGNVTASGATLTGLAGTGDRMVVTNSAGVLSATVTNNSSNWNTAYGWGNHASAGYVTGTPWTSVGYITSSGSCSYASTAGSASANDVYSWAKESTKPSYSWSEIGSKPTNLSSFTNDLGNYGSWITGFTETDPLSLHLTGGTLTGALYGTTATFTGVITAYNFGLSDIHYKNSILPIATQYQFNGEYKQYYMNDDKTHTLRFGVPAQDLQKYLPNLVSENPADNRLMVNYTDLHSLEIHNLKKEVRLLKEQLRQFQRN